MTIRMSGGALLIPIIAVAVVLPIVLLWPGMSSYLSILMLGGNKTTPVNVPPASGNNTGNDTTPDPQLDSVSLLSTPSAFPFADKWIGKYNNENSDATAERAYSNEAETISQRSSTDLYEFLSKSSVDVVITGNAPEWNSTFDNGTSVVPVAPQAVAIVYNVPGFPDVPSGLRLDPPTLSAILNGNVSFWDDANITSLNPGRTLPHERITVIHSPEERSTSKVLQQYLSAANRTATWWNTTIPVDNPSDVAAEVRRTQYSIAYLEYSYAIQTRMTYAAIQNHDGDFVLPSSRSISSSIMNGTRVVEGERLANSSSLQNSSSMPAPRITLGRLGNGSYPIVGFYYMMFRAEDVSQELTINGDTSNQTSNQTDAERTRSYPGEFITWIVSDRGQRILGEVGYPSLYEQNDELLLYRDRLFD